MARSNVGGTAVGFSVCIRCSAGRAYRSTATRSSANNIPPIGLHMGLAHVAAAGIQNANSPNLVSGNGAIRVVSVSPVWSCGQFQGY
jgi:hypothetical protein